MVMGRVSARPRSARPIGLYRCDFAFVFEFFDEVGGDAAARSISSRDCGFSHNGEVIDALRGLEGGGWDICSGEPVRGVICPGDVVRGAI